MFMEVRSRYSYVWQYMLTNFQSAMEYRASFLSQLVFMFLNNFMLLFFWWVLFEQIDALNGWGFQEIMILYAISAGSFSFQALVFGASFKISHIIANGQLDYFLALPKPPLLHLLLSSSSASAWGDLLFSIVIYSWGINGAWQQLIWYPIFIVTGGLVMTFYAVIVHSFSFWLGHSGSFGSQLYEALLTFSLYPEEIFGGITRIILYTAIPAGFVSYLPVRLLSTQNPWLFLASVVFTVCFGLCARFVFYRGLVRYESGNLVVVKV